MGRIEDLSFQTESFLIGVFLAILIKDALLPFDVAIALSDDVIDASNGSFNTRIKIVLYVIVTSPIEACFFKATAELAPLVALFAEQ